MEQLKARYEKYARKALSVREKAGPMEGIFGFGGPKNHPCHMEFFEDVQSWVEEFLASQPDDASCEEAAWFLIRAPKEMGQADSYWMMYAAQGLAQKLVSQLSAESCRSLQEYYDANYPQKDRLPAQAKLYKMLKKGAGKR